VIGPLLMALADLAAADGQLIVAHDALRVGERDLGAPRVITAVAISPDGRLLAEVGGRAGAAGRVALWDLERGERLWQVEPHGELVYDAAWSPDGALLYTAGGDGRIGRLTVDGRELEALEGHSDQVLSLAVAPDGTLASGSLDRTVRLWRDGQEQRSLTRHAGAVNALAFSPDGQQLASASGDGTVRIWQHAIGRQRKIVDLERGRALSVLWSEGGLYAGTSDGAVCELDWVRARVRAVLGGHDDWVEGLVLVDGELVSIDARGEIRRCALTDPE
jgi:WD40 repeat protein